MVAYSDHHTLLFICNQIVHEVQKATVIQEGLIMRNIWLVLKLFFVMSVFIKSTVENLYPFFAGYSWSMRRRSSPHLSVCSRPRCSSWMILLQQLKWTDSIWWRSRINTWTIKVLVGSACGVSRWKWLIARLNWLVSGGWATGSPAQVW